jgi:hypothetical protein
VASPWLKGLVIGILIGVVGFFLVDRVVGNDESVPQQLAEVFGCSDGINPSTAAAAHHAEDGSYFSWFAATHAEQVLYVNGCDPVGPGTLYLQYAPEIEMEHVLATLHHFGALCIAGQAIFDGKMLEGRAELEQLCSAVGGKLEVLEHQH